jgi:hypothetical protein
LVDLIIKGHGCGHLNKYRPWLRIHRKNASPVSNQVVACMPGYERQAHFFARVEWYVALLCLWLGAFDVREQFPLWPMDHKHPLAPDGRVWNMPDVKGLWSIAQRAGIRHGTEVGSDGVPYVATMDLMVTLDNGRHQNIAAVSLKPHDKVSKAEPTDRLIERQELERLYMVQTNGPYSIADASILTPILQGNLDVCGQFARVRPDDSERVIDFLRFVEDVSPRLEQRTAVLLGARASGLTLPSARQQLMAAIWHRRIDVDITKPIRPDLPVSLGGARIAARLQRELFGRTL